MKPLFTQLIIITAIAFASCKKDKVEQPPVPLPEPVAEMEYSNLNNAEVKFMQNGVWIDLNKDNRNDVLFEVLHVGDAINKQDKFRFNITTSIRVNLPVNTDEQIPVFQKGAIITTTNLAGTNWYGASEVTLIEKVVFENNAIAWQGNWLTAQKAYVPLQIIISGKWHNGWIELSADHQHEKLILHRAAISKEPEKTIKAGF